MNRQCGSCQLCCVLLPVRDNLVNVLKDAGEKCRHQSYAKGCKVYHKPGFPLACGVWSCLWLTDPDTHEMHRPDRTGYVLDALPDIVTFENGDTGEKVEITVLQVWVDPNRPEAWRDPALLRYGERLGERGVAMLLRYSGTRAVLAVAPIMNGTSEWKVSTNSIIEESVTGSRLLDRVSGL